MDFNRLTRRVIGSTLILSAVFFGKQMDNIAATNTDHLFVIQFQRGVTPSAEFTGIIEDVSDLLAENSNYTVRVVGHSGTRGPDESNMTLSEDRADVTVAALDRAGVDLSRISAVGLGETAPLPQGDHETDALWQRRLGRANIYVEVN